MRGIGTDIIEIARVAHAMKSNRFMHRVFTHAERAYIAQAPQPPQTAAGIFCAKEAISKALGIAIGAGLTWTDIEIGHTPQGQPLAQIQQTMFSALSLSISHCKEYAMATAVVWGDGNAPATN